MEKAEKACGKVYPIELKILLPTSDTLIPLNIPIGINKHTKNGMIAARLIKLKNLFFLLTV